MQTYFGQCSVDKWNNAQIYHISEIAIAQTTLYR